MRSRTAAGVGIAAVVAVVAALWTCAGDGDPPPPVPPGDGESATDAASEQKVRVGTAADNVAVDAAPPAPPPTVVRRPDVQVVRLTDPDGKPLAGAYVEVQGEKLPVRWASADKSGVASFAGLPDAPLVVRVRPSAKALEAFRVLRRPGDLSLAWRRLEVCPKFPQGGESDARRSPVTVFLHWWPRRVDGPDLSHWHESTEPWRADVPPDPGWVTAGTALWHEWAPLRVGPVDPGGSPITLALEPGVRIEGRIVGSGEERPSDARWLVVLLNERPGAYPPVIGFGSGPVLESPVVARGSTWTLIVRPGEDEGEFAVVPGVVAPAASLTVATAPGRPVRVRVEPPPKTDLPRPVRILCWPARSSVLAGTMKEVLLPSDGTSVILHGPDETLAFAGGDDGDPLHAATPVLATPSDAETVLPLVRTPVLRVALRFADGAPVTFGRLRVEPLSTGQGRYVLRADKAGAGAAIGDYVRMGYGTGTVARLGEDGRFVCQVLPGRRRLTWYWFKDVEIDLGEVDVPAAGDVVLTLPTADR